MNTPTSPAPDKSWSLEDDLTKVLIELQEGIKSIEAKATPKAGLAHLRIAEEQLVTMLKNMVTPDT